MSKVVVYHAGHGCETGCCGHWVKLDGDADEYFSFSHPYGDDPREYAEMIVRAHFGAEHVADLDWDNCVIVDD